MNTLAALVRGLPKSLLTLTLVPFTMTAAKAAIGQAPALHTTTLAWTPPSQTVQNYRLFVGTESQQYTQFYDSGTAPTVSVGDLEQGRTYYFAVCAIGVDGMESAFSGELVIKVAPATLPVGASMAPPVSGSRSLQWSYPIDGLGSNPSFIVQGSTDMVNWTNLNEVTASSLSFTKDGQTAKFTYPITSTAPRMFYRMTARNFVGSATTN